MHKPLRVVAGRQQNLQAEVARLVEREAAIHADNQHLHQSVIQLGKVSCAACILLAVAA